MQSTQACIFFVNIVDCLTLYLLCLPDPTSSLCIPWGSIGWKLTVSVGFTLYDSRLTVEVEVLVGVTIRYGVL